MKYTKAERKMIHRYAELVEEQDLAEVKRILQEYAARKMNREYQKIKDKQKKMQWKKPPGDGGSFQLLLRKENRKRICKKPYDKEDYTGIDNEEINNGI